MKKFALLMALLVSTTSQASNLPSAFTDCAGSGSLRDYFACVNDYVGPVETVATFNALLGENPESMAIDSQGNLLITMGLTGEIRKVAPNGTQTTLAFLDVGPFDLFTFSGFIGAIAVDDNDDVFVCLSSGNAGSRGVWQVFADGSTQLLANLPMTAAPNGIAVKGNYLYVADALGGLIYRVSKDGGTPTVWADSPLLKPIPGVPLPGPNGIQFFNGEFYVSVSATNLLVAIEKNGNSAGAVRVAATLPQGCDDFAMDVAGSAYCTTDLFQTVLRIKQDGSSEVILTAADGLDGPTATVFGRSNLTDFFTLYITNAAFPIPAPPGFPPPPGNGSSIKKVQLGRIGVPRFAF